MCNYYRITNYNSVQEGYYRWTGCTGGIISVSTINPLDNQYICAENIEVENYSAPLDIVFMGLCPSSTPTPTMTPTNTMTPTITPSAMTPTPTQTNTPTPTLTPTLVLSYNLVGGGYYQDVCDSINFGTPANVTIYCSKSFSDLQVGDHVYGDRSFSIPPINAKSTITNGATFIQISGTLIVNVGQCS